MIAAPTSGADRVRAATVMLPRMGGQGVLIPGGLVLTAAHCIRWDGRGGMVLGDYHLETIQTKAGREFRMSVLAVEPVADIAVLCAADEQAFRKDAVAFETFAESTAPVPVNDDDLDEHGLRVYVLSHRDAWIAATVERNEIQLPGWDGDGPSVWLESSDANIESGTSGGPVVDETGALIGVVSNAGGVGDTISVSARVPASSSLPIGTSGTLPRPHMALPTWVWRRIQIGQAVNARKG